MAAERKNSLSTFVVDITNKAAVEELLNNIIQRFGYVDGIINNAGIIQPFVKLNDLGYDAIDRVMNVNLFGSLYIIKTFLPHLLTRPEAHIINTSSMGGFLPVPGQTIYGASKAAVKLLTEGLHSELTGTNVNVTVVFPGAINTYIMKNSGLGEPPPASTENKSMKILSAAKAAEIIIDAMEKNKYRVFVGKDAAFLDKFYRLNPRRASEFIGKKMKGRLSGN